MNFSIASENTLDTRALQAPNEGNLCLVRLHHDGQFLHDDILKFSYSWVATLI